MTRGSATNLRMTENRRAISKIGQKPKSKRPKSNLSYCQQLAQDLDRSEAFKKLKPGCRERPSHSLLLALPAEIRQHILCNVLDDDDILSLELDRQAR